MYQIEAGLLFLEITDACNFSCPFCFNGENRGHSFISKENFYKIIDKIDKFGINKLAISGGEPLLHPECKEFLYFLQKRRFVSRLITNGYLIDKDILDYFILNPENILQISLDGADSITNDFFRCSGGYEKVISVIKELHKNGYKKGILRMTITKKNFDQIEEFCHICNQYSFRPSFSVVQKLGIAKKNWEELSLSNYQYSSVIQVMKKLAEEDPRFEWELKNVNPITKCPLMEDQSPLLKPRIDVKGNVFPCQMLGEKSQCIGNILSDDLNEIFSLQFDQMKKKMKVTIEEHAKERCTKCAMKDEICFRGCPGIFLNEDEVETSRNCFNIKYLFISNNYLG